MKNITVYDEDEEIIERISEELDTTEAEVIEYLLENLSDDAKRELKGII